MADRTLNRCRILVVEDEYLLADELSAELSNEGAIVLGPVPTVKDALSVIENGDAPDGAILDVNLGGEPVFPVADVLISRGVPLVFTTGYDSSALPPRFQHLPRCEKPVSIRRITAALGKALHP